MGYSAKTDSQGYVTFEIPKNASVDGIDYTASKDDIEIKWTEGETIPDFAKQAIGEEDDDGTPWWIWAIAAVLIIVGLLVIVGALRKKEEEPEPSVDDIADEYDWDSMSKEELEAYAAEHELVIEGMEDMGDDELRAAIDEIVAEQLSDDMFESLYEEEYGTEELENLREALADDEDELLVSDDEIPESEEIDELSEEPLEPAPPMDE